MLNGAPVSWNSRRQSCVNKCDKGSSLDASPGDGIDCSQMSQTPIMYQNVNTENQIAVIMKMVLNEPRFQRFKNEMGLNAKAMV